MKPDNILINEGKDGQIREVKLADFGLACKASKDDQYKDENCGTLGYIAPEMLKGGGRYTDKVDVWALGVILFNLVTG